MQSREFALPSVYLFIRENTARRARVRRAV